MKHSRMALLELVQQHIRRRDMSELLNEIVAVRKTRWDSDDDG